MTNKNLTLSDFGAILQRRKYHFNIPVILILSLSFGLAFMLPPVYRSTATILIEQQEIPDELVATTITGYAAERIERIRSHVMSRATLLSIIRQFNLYPEAMDRADEYKAVSQMYEDTGMEMVSAEVPDPRSRRSIIPTIAFSLYYENRSPEIAQQVTARLAEIYLAENRRSRTEKARTTSAFLAEEAQRLGSEISDLESKLATFKSENADYLPETIERNQELRHAAMLELSRISATMGTLEQRRIYLNNQLASRSGNKLARAKEELRAAREIYSDIHPDVISLKEAVNALEKGSGSYLSASSDPDSLMLQSELQEVLGNIRSAQAQIRDLKNNISTYEGRLARSPEAERRYSSLIRDLDNATEKYREIRDKLMEARLAEELEKEQKAERFTLIDMANLPKTPIRPNRIGIVLLGILLALGGGIGVTAVAEYIDRRIHSPGDLAAVFGAPPLGTIPEIPVADMGRGRS